MHYYALKPLFHKREQRFNMDRDFPVGISPGIIVVGRIPFGVDAVIYTHQSVCLELQHLVCVAKAVPSKWIMSHCCHVGVIGKVLLNLSKYETTVWNYFRWLKMAMSFLPNASWLHYFRHRTTVESLTMQVA